MDDEPEQGAEHGGIAGREHGRGNVVIGEDAGPSVRDLADPPEEDGEAVVAVSLCDLVAVEVVGDRVADVRWSSRVDAPGDPQREGDPENDHERQTLRRRHCAERAA